MTTLTYTTLANLVAGNPENVADVVDCLQKIATVINGNVDDATNLTSPTNAVWRTVLECNAGATAGTLSTTPAYFTNGGNAQASAGTTGTGIQGFWTPPSAADVAVPGKTTRLRLRVTYGVNATAPAITITWGLYPVTAIAGTANVISVTLGAVIAGSTVSVVTPAANAGNILTGTSFDLSAVTGATSFVIGVVGSGSAAANSFVTTAALLEMRHT